MCYIIDWVGWNIYDGETSNRIVFSYSDSLQDFNEQTAVESLPDYQSLC